MNSSFMVAVLLGLLTFVVTGVAALIIIIALLPFGINLAAILLYGAWGGFIGAQVGLFILFVLFGDFCTAVISWFVTGSKKLSVVTFVSALIFQAMAITLMVPATMKTTQTFKEATIAAEESYTQYATMGNVSVEAQEPFTFPYYLDGELIEAPLFKKLVFTVPVAVTQAGTYSIYLKYTSNSINYANSKSPSDITQFLDAGEHLVRIEFVAGAAPNLGYEAPSTVQGRAEVTLSYVASKQELMNSSGPKSAFEQKIYQQFLEDERLNQAAPSRATVNKFVERKEVQF